MKTIIFIAVISIGVISCQKTSPLPIVMNNVSNTTTTQSILNSDEIATKGNWDLRSSMVYISSVPQPSMTNTYNSGSNYFIKLDSIDVVPQNGQWKTAVNSIMGYTVSTQWQGGNDTIVLGFDKYKIDAISTTTLVLHYKSVTQDTLYIYNFQRQ